MKPGFSCWRCLATLVTPTWSNHWLRHPQGASLGSAPTMCKPRSTWSHSFPVSVSRSLQVSLLASQPTESAAGGEALWRACNLTWFSTMSHWSSGLTCLLPVTRDPGSNPLGELMWNWDSPVSVVSLQCQLERVSYCWDYNAIRPQSIFHKLNLLANNTPMVQWSFSLQYP